MKRFSITLIAVAAATAALAAADTPWQVFARAWEGRRVTVKSTLFSLIYNERNKVGATHSGLRDGLVVVTPSDGVYFQFDGRQRRDTVRQYEVGRIINAVNVEYQPDALEVRAYRRIEALAVNRYDPGAELVISSVTIDRDIVRFAFTQGDPNEVVTTLRVKWPLPVSKAFNERPLVEQLVQQFVEVGIAATQR